jgi:3-dehydroquinate synthetase
LVTKAGLPVDIPSSVAVESLMHSMELDKKSNGREIKFVMCEGIGKTRFHRLKPEEIVKALEE